MAVVPDAASSFGNVGGTTFITFPHTCTGADRAIAVGVSNTTSADPISVTYGLVALTKMRSGPLPSDGDNSSIWASVGFQPASGANNIVVTFAVSQGIAAGAVSVTGADQTDCVSNTPSATTGTSTTPSITCTSAAGELVLGHVATFSSRTGTPGTGETERYDKASIAAGGMVAMGYTQAGAASVTIAPTISASTEWAMVAISFKASGGASVPFLNLSPIERPLANPLKVVGY